MAFTDKQRAFIDHYVQCFNATEAARRAGYSEKTARHIASENLAKPDIREEIDRLIADRIMSRDEALSRLADIARFDVSQYVTHYGRQAALDVDKLIDDGLGHLIRGIKHTQAGTVIEWADPDAALDRVLRELRPLGTEDDPAHVSIKVKVQLDDD